MTETVDTMKLSDLLVGVDVLDIFGDISEDVSNICYDSRKCEKGSAFIAISGIEADGHNFIDDALRRGAACVVYDKDNESVVDAAVSCIKVADSRLAMARMGKNFYGNPSSGICLIGVTGTNGKTTITYLLESVLRSAGFSVGVIGTVNYRYGAKVFPSRHTTPESVDLQRILREMVDSGVTHVVMEVSSHAIDLKRVYGCEYDLGIFTNLSPEHLDYHGTMEEYFLVKKRFFDDLLERHTVVVNVDDPWGTRLYKEIQPPTFTFGLHKPCDLLPADVVLSIYGIKARMRWSGGDFPIFSHLAGRFNLSNILAAVAAALSIGVPQGKIISGLELLNLVPGRLERVSSKAGEPAVFVDYAHTPDALEKVLDTLLEVRKKRLITVFGCGGNRDRLKRPLMGKIAVEMSDLAIITSDNPRTEDPAEIMKEIESGIEGSVKRYSPEDITRDFTEKGYLIVADRKEAIDMALCVADDSDIVLVAGKGHEDYQILGTTKVPFDDRLVVREALLKRTVGGAS